MTKQSILNLFQDKTHHWTSYIQIRRYANILKKDECNLLLELANSGIKEFRLFKNHGYALDEYYNRIYIYDRRK